MPYPPRRTERAEQWAAGTARSGTTALGGIQGRLEAFIVAEYRNGLSLRQVAEKTDRSQTAIRRVLNKHAVPRRPRGAAPVPRR